MGNKIICIGRECGSGGYEAAIRLSQQLKLHIYARNLLHLACDYGGLPVERLADADEKATNPYLYETVHEGNHHVKWGTPTSEVLFQLQSHEIRRIAARESCIFVGRCADYVLQNSDVEILSVFLRAPLERRIERKMELDNLSYRRAKRMVTHMDTQRKKYYEHYTGKPWGSAESYDLLFDTGETPMELVVAEISMYYGKLGAHM